MATGASIGRAKAQPTEQNQPLQADPQSMEERIRLRAHEIWLQRDGQIGSDVEDWLQAEKEIRSGTT